MKKLKYLVLLLVMSFALTGCVKFNANMEIKKDKSMDFSIIYAFNESLMQGEETVVTAEEREEIEKQGFKVEDYAENNMKGVKLTKHINNIDSVSKEGDVEYNLSGMMEAEDNTYMFKVSKSFLKNTYTAKFKFDTSDSMNMMEDEEEEQTPDFENYNPVEEEVADETLTTGAGDDTLTIGAEDEDDSLDLSGLNDPSLYANMDLSFNVTLPYGAKTNNATEVNKNTYKWNLTNLTGASYIEFSFEVYNINPVIMYGAIGLLVIIVIAVVVLLIKKNKKQELPTEPLINNPTPEPVVNSEIETPKVVNNDLQSPTIVSEDNTSSNDNN